MCKEGRYKEVRLETAFESFEFTPNSSGQVYNMLHIPKLGTEHMQFQGGLKTPFTLEDCFIYVNQHSKGKYSKRVRFNKRLKAKIKA